MALEQIEYLKHHNYYYLKENSYWYGILHQDPGMWKNYLEFVSKKYGLGKMGKLQKRTHQLEEVTNLIDLFLN